MYRGTIIEFLNMGGGEIMLILAVVLLLFGGKKLPELARGLGKGIREFKDASDGVKREIQRNINSVGIEEEVNSIISDVKDDRHHPSESYMEEQQHPSEEKSAGINLNKEEAVAQDAPAEHAKIETDKTNL
ncbi:MAG TPA: twin-arginine translocase TatA/TatE family subunit [Pedobacter sp.]|nr:twin-arginine translocase TatA/TatE family subunit [Pedobacter sp.]